MHKLHPVDSLRRAFSQRVSVALRASVALCAPVVFSSAVFAQTGGTYTPTRSNIVVVNGNFEFVREDIGAGSNIVLSPGEYTLGLSSTLANLTGDPFDPLFVPRFVPGWSTPYEYDELSGVIRRDSSRSDFPYNDAGSIRGFNVAYLRDDVIEQITLGTLVPDIRYELRFRVGRHADSTNFSPPSTEIRLGDTTLVPVTAVTPTPAPGEFADWAVTYRVSRNSPVLGQPLTLRIAGGGGEVVDIDDVQLVVPASGTPQAVVTQWNFSSGGLWSEIGKWSFGRPELAGTEAQFFSAAAVHADIVVDREFTLGKMRFANAVGYTLHSAFDGLLTLDSGNGANVVIDSSVGSHSIFVPIQLNNDLDLVVADSSLLRIGATLESTTPRTITRNGMGVLDLDTTPAFPAGSRLRVQAGTTNLNTNLGSPGVATISLDASGVGTVVHAAAELDLLDLNITAQSQMNLGSGTGVLSVRTLLVDEATLVIGDATVLVDQANAATLTAAIRSAFVGENGIETGIAGRSVGLIDLDTYFGGMVPGVYLGRPVDAQTLMLRASLPGDSNLDGLVNFEDLLAVARAFDGSGFWSDGDFDFDGQVGFADLLIVARSFSGSPVIDGGAIDSAFAGDFALARSLVPEPVLMSVIGVAATLGLRRSRRAAV